MLREGSGEPLLLLHGIISGERTWLRVIPHLSGEFDVIATTALGHNGGPSPTRRPATMADVFDAAEKQLDDLGIERAHLAGNSMGGWAALELARRGRALSVCAICPAGLWDEDWEEADRERVFAILLGAVRDTRRGRRLIPLLARSRRFRKWASRDFSVNGDRVSREGFVIGAEDVVGCEIAEELIVPGVRFEGYDPPHCPVTIALGEQDKLFPPALYEARAKDLVPAARVLVLEGVGHVPMADDPELIARTIRDSTRSAAALSSPGS
ncbi:MAG TPA: alpha/beta hydrolase [Solirubrobacterales bacterium]